MPGSHHLTISARSVGALSADGKNTLYWDRSLPGFGVRVVSGAGTPPYHRGTNWR